MENNINKTVTRKLADLLKNKGFEENVRERYQNGDGISGLVTGTFDNFNNKGEYYVSAPRIAEVIDWLYSKYGFWIWVKPYKDHGDDVNDPYQAQMNVFKKGITATKEFNTIDEAYEAAVEYCLTLI